VLDVKALLPFRDFPRNFVGADGVGAIVGREDHMTKARAKPRRGRELLSPLSIKRAGIGHHCDGGGLMLVVKRSKITGEVHRTWVFRYSSPIHTVPHSKTGNPVGKRRDMGLGSAASVSLTAAREMARQYAEAIKKDQRDPIDHQALILDAARKTKLEEQAKALAEKNRERNTLRKVARAYHAQMVEPHRSTKDALQWINSIEHHVPANMLDKPIEDIQPKELLELLRSLRTKVRETGRRVGQRLGLIFADGKLNGIVSNNPLHDIKHALRETKRDKAKATKSFAALPYAEVPGFVQGKLRNAPGTAARALEFAILTAARTGEVIGATWDEFDLDGAVWVIPAKRMKVHEQHVVHLSPQAIEIVKQMQALGGRFVFPSPMNVQKPLSNMAMLNVLKRLGFDDRTTVHGFRSSFSSWAYESAQRARPDLARQDVVEACLAHAEEDRVKAAYNRAKFEDDRAELLRLWSQFVDSKLAPVREIGSRAKVVA
jgi:integrase